jgi:preprotein translocase subunit SecD
LARSQVQFDPNTGQPVVGLEFNQEGGDKFAEITGRNVGRPVAIFLDQFPITIPLVKEQITTNEAVITGEFSVDEAKSLAIQLNAGALPVPIEVIEQRNIGATLGTESVQNSVQAGVIGLLMVIGFMAAYYGYLGILADIGLVIYGLLTLALYKLIPVTLTLPGVAGFLLSVGMAVDSNILIFERMKEEIRAGRPRAMAMELGFGRAWDSIRDANVCTLITCFILFNPFSWSFLNTSGMVRGFALTLGLGVLLSLFTGVVVTRTILRTFSFRRGEDNQKPPRRWRLKLATLLRGVTNRKSTS